MIYEKIQKLCKERGITIYKLEKELNFSESSICKWKSSNPSIDKVQAVADYFDVTVDFFDWKELMNDMPKKIVAAWIEQILEFDSKLEYLAYVESLKRKKGKFKELEYQQDNSGKVTLRIRKQYNNNVFPEKDGDKK